jgi:hypothetical protein
LFDSRRTVGNATSRNPLIEQTQVAVRLWIIGQGTLQADAECQRQ